MAAMDDPELHGKIGAYPKLSAIEKSQVADEKFYTVEKILEKKKVGKKTLYYVKWDGFPSDQGTWEPLQNLKNVKEMVKDFESKQSKEASIAQ